MSVLRRKQAAFRLAYSVMIPRNCYCSKPHKIAVNRQGKTLNPIAIIAATKYLSSAPRLKNKTSGIQATSTATVTSILPF